MLNGPKDQKKNIPNVIDINLSIFPKNASKEMYCESDHSKRYYTMIYNRFIPFIGHTVPGMLYSVQHLSTLSQYCNTICMLILQAGMEYYNIV